MKSGQGRGWYNPQAFNSARDDHHNQVKGWKDRSRPELDYKHAEKSQEAPGYLPLFLLNVLAL